MAMGGRSQFATTMNVTAFDRYVSGSIAVSESLLSGPYPARRRLEWDTRFHSGRMTAGDSLASASTSV